MTVQEGLSTQSTVSASIEEEMLALIICPVNIYFCRVFVLQLSGLATCRFVTGEAMCNILQMPMGNGSWFSVPKCSLLPITKDLPQSTLPESTSQVRSAPLIERGGEAPAD
jgi:hypothetical protein